MATPSIALDSRRGLALKRRGRRLRAAVQSSPLTLSAGLLLLALIVGVAIAAPLFGSPIHQDLRHGLTPDGFPLSFGDHRYVFGTDALGRNMLARLAYGARASLTVGVVSTITSLALGLGVGVLAGFYRGWVETALMRLADVALSVPTILAALVIAATLPAGIWRAIIIITALTWAYTGRVIFGEVERLRSSGFIEASEVAGSSGVRTIRKHLVPHVMPLLITYMPLTVAQAILFEAGLSFLGAGINPPTPSWGNLISDGQQSLSTSPHLLLEPGIALAVGVLAFILIGEGLKARHEGVSRTSWLDV